MKIKLIILSSLILSSPVSLANLSAEVNSNDCSAVWAISPNCSGARGEGSQQEIEDTIGKMVDTEVLNVLNPSAVIIEIDDYNYTQAKLKEDFNSRAVSASYRGCKCFGVYGMIYKESFKWNPELKEISTEFNTSKTLKHAVHTKTLKNKRCTSTEVAPSWSAAPSNFSTSGSAKIENSFNLQYSFNSPTFSSSKSSSVKLVDRVEPFIYYK